MIKTVQSRLNRGQGFTLVELLVVIAIILILGAVVLLVINPGEVQKKARDAVRISDLESLQTSINLAVQEATGSSPLCNDLTGSCTGRSDTGTRAVDGTGWVKVNLAQPKTANISVLPTDPVNDGTYHYTYGVDSNQTGYEIDTVFESQFYSPKMKTDGGNNDNAYEVGTNLSALP